MSEYESYSTCVVVLIINKIPILPEIAMRSILSNSKCNIYIGYVNEIDLEELPQDKRINLIKLDGSGFKNTGYQDFTTFDFYSIVQLKWQLFEKVMNETSFEFIIYSDVDVLWMQNPIEHIGAVFKKYSNVRMLVQSDTRRPDFLVPCMGFVAFRNDPLSMKIIRDCRNLHIDMTDKGKKKIGDDEVMGYYVRESDDLNWYRELPQITFPIGAFTNVYNKKSLFPGLNQVSPFIFHANYTVGLERKLQMLGILYRQYPNNDFPMFKIPIKWRINEYLRIIKNRYSH